MNNVVDEVLASAPRYNIKDNGGTAIYSNVQIELATQVTTQGTPLNKALFDSIRDDINSRLLISNKATQQDIWAGTNDTKYVTPLKLQQKLNSLISTQSQENSATSSQTYTILTFADFDNAKVFTIRGVVDTNTYGHSFIINGGRFEYHTPNGRSYSNNTLTLDGYALSEDVPFEFTFDLSSKTFKGQYIASGSQNLQTFLGRFNSITNFQIKLGRQTSYSLSVQYSN